MTANFINSLLSLGNSLLPSIRASPSASSSSSSDNKSVTERRAVEEHLERLIATLEQIKPALCDAEERQISDRSDKLWLKEVKRLAYTADDVLNEYRYEATRVLVEARKASQTSGLHKRKQMEHIAPIPHGMGDRLNKINSQFDEIAKHREDLQLREIDGMRRPDCMILRPPTGHMVDKTSVFGRDADVTKVIDLLLSENEKSFSVIPIIGKGGLGKTTIAQLVYKDARVRQYFDLFGWVCVSENFNIGRIIKAILESFTRKKCGFSEVRPLQEELVKLVKDRKTLLVLDDVWNENQSLWELFRIPLYKTAKWIRILVTTRSERVAEVMLTTTCFRPDYLPEVSCWQLFQHFAFGGKNYVVPTYFVEMGREIMRKCGGIPLAVKSIASLLRHKTDEKSWSEILASDLWESNASNDIFPALHFSYSHLPAHLKPCFLFCSMYPKDYRLEKKNLIELWISHGYIESQSKRRITQVGVEYYEELKERSFLDDFSDEFTEFCKLHDIIHDLARLNSDNEHYSMDINQPHETFERNIPGETYHLYSTGFMGYINQIPQQNLKGLRTLSTDLRGCNDAPEHQCCINSIGAMDLNVNLSGNYEDCWLRTSTCILNLTKFEALRVLELKGDRLREIPNSISKLKHLSHLRIESDWLDMLPDSIGLLYNLQTFFLYCERLEYLPESIGYLANLQYLWIECAEFKELPESLGLISNLQKLVIKSDELEKIPSDIGKLSNLHELTIDSKQLEAIPDTIGCLSSLEELEFHSVDALSELAGALGNCRKLKTLKAYGCSLEYNPDCLENFRAMKTMAACLGVETIGWLKDMKDLEGELIIEGLQNMSNLEDARQANLSRKYKIETLNLCWHNLREHEHLDGWEELTIRILKDSDESPLLGEDMNFSLLECLKPHRHLKKLVLEGYPSATVPHWMGDPLSMQAIQEIRLIGCDGLQSLPFRNFHTLKHFKFQSCAGFQVLKLEQLPFQLENLEISWCEELELITGLQNLEMLTALEINCCKILKSMTIDEHELQLAESTEPGGSSTHENPCGRQQKTLSLTRLVILCCPLLRGLPYKLERSQQCNVWWVYGCGCPDLHFGNPSIRS